MSECISQERMHYGQMGSRFVFLDKCQGRRVLFVLERESFNDDPFLAKFSREFFDDDLFLAKFS